MDDKQEIMEVTQGSIEVYCPSVGTVSIGNRGNGTCTGVSPGVMAKIGTYTIRCINATVQGAEIFSVIDPDGIVLANAKVGFAYNSNQINFVLNEGTWYFGVGDTFTVIIISSADETVGEQATQFPTTGPTWAQFYAFWGAGANPADHPPPTNLTVAIPPNTWSRK